MGKLEKAMEFYQLQMEELREAKREDLIEALGQEIYDKLKEAYQKGVRVLMDKIPELLKWTKDPLATRYRSIYEVFRHRVGRCGEWAHFAFGVLYLFDVKPLELVVDWTDHIWLIVQGSHYDPTLGGEARYDKTYYARNWKKPYSFMLAINPSGSFRDVTADYVEMTPEVIQRRKKIEDKKYIFKKHPTGVLFCF